MRSMAKLRTLASVDQCRRKVVNTDVKSHLCSYQRGETFGTKSLEEALRSDNAELAARKGSELDSRDREATQMAHHPDLIFDLGSHKSEHTDFYLKTMYTVLAF